MKNFQTSDLYQPIRRALADQNYETPTSIQEQTIPAAIRGEDILGVAQTGTGKTAAFALPILDFIGNENPRSQAGRPTVLVLAPTRELAIQISESFTTYGAHMKFRQALVYGGVNQQGQVNALRRGADVLVATPGRLLDLMEQNHVSLRDIEIFVLDEADRMLDMGFMPAIKQIVADLPRDRQSLFFSATMPEKIRELSRQLLFNPLEVKVTPKPSVRKIEQSVQLVDRTAKYDTLLGLIGGESVERVIVFARTKRGANTLAKRLTKSDVSCTAIHGNKSQAARQKAITDFKADRIQVLVATDVAARGIDVQGVSHVINYDMPVEPESYVHRVGRTGRAGAVGRAISFCTADERPALHAIEDCIGHQLKVENPEFKMSSSSSPATAGQPRRGRSSGGRPSSAKAGGRRRNSSRNARRPAKRQSAAV